MQTTRHQPTRFKAKTGLGDAAPLNASGLNALTGQFWRLRTRAKAAHPVAGRAAFVLVTGVVAFAVGVARRIAHAPEPVPHLDDHRVIRWQRLGQLGGELVQHGIVRLAQPLVRTPAPHT